MSALTRSFLLLGIVLLITALVPIFGCPAPGQGQDNLTGRVEDLEAQLAELRAKTAYITIQQGNLNGLAGPHMIVEGCNVHVRSGSGSTSDETVARANVSSEDKALPLGLGNLIVGYNEEPLIEATDRAGSHNLIVGSRHNYPNVAGVVFGLENTASGISCTVLGGYNNEASGDYSSVGGGARNASVGNFAAVASGDSGTAEGNYSGISGGKSNTASGVYSSVSGGSSNEASGVQSSISGGSYNNASGVQSGVSGGYQNASTNQNASISGGSYNIASGGGSSVAGGSGNTASGLLSIVSGGSGRDASGTLDWVAGGLWQDE